MYCGNRSGLKLRAPCSLTKPKPSTTCTPQYSGLCMRRDAFVSYSLQRIRLWWLCCIYLQLLWMNDWCISKRMLGRAPASTFWPPTVPNVPGRACWSPLWEWKGAGLAHLQDILLTELIKNSPHGGTTCPKVPSSIGGSRVWKAWASQRARRAGKKAETV